MAQHDFVIANQGFPATRSDINNFLQAVATTHSGTSTPSGAVAGTIWLDTTTATAPILKYYDGTDNITLATIDHVTNTVNFSDSALDLLTDTTPQLGGNLDVNGNSIVSTSNGNITLTPNGTGDVVLSADTVKIGDANANATITTDGTGDLILNTNSGTNSGAITIADGANGAITIAGNGTGQIIVNAGAVGTPTIAPTGDTNTGIFFPSADTIAFTEGGSEAMRIDSSGNVGIGTTAPATKLHLVSGTNTQNRMETTDTGSVAVTQYKNAVGETHTIGSETSSGNSGFGGSSAYSLCAYAGGTTRDINFGTNGALRMRIDSSGNLLVGTTSSLSTLANSANASGLIYGPTDSLVHSINNSNDNLIINRTSSNTTGACVRIRFNGFTVGTITTNGTTTAYNTSSDYRLKENVNYNFDATTRLKQLKPARFNFIADANKTVDGFLAHEVQSVIPEAITGTKDETETKEKVVVNVIGNVIAENIEQADWVANKIPNEQGESQYPVNSTWEASKVVPVYQGIDQAKLTPILTKALQEAIAKIESLEARLTALENN